MRIASTYSKNQVHIYRWLLTGCVLVVLMVVIGGITRLTQSGLSMVKWEPIMGTLPPLSDQEWNEAFEMYQQSPEFHHYNSHFTLSDFKSIFFWEYFHRLIARIIGLVFIVPCVWFWMKGFFSPRLKKQVVLIFVMGALQGVLGWVMVKSGLIDKPHVSHYRLAAHLITALILLIYMLWVALNLKFEMTSPPQNNLRKYVKWLFVFLGIQIIYGAFVAGLKAGLMYTTYPKMGNEWIPESFGEILNKDGLIGLFESGGIVQFIHRTIALVVIAFVLFIGYKARKMNMGYIQKNALNAVIGIIFFQCVLGVFTLIHAVPVFLGVLHQFVAILVLLISIFFLFSLTQSKQAI